MRAHADGSIEPWLLESLEQQSPTSWLLTLRKGITFQNGNPLDAEMLTALVNDAMSTNEDLQAAVPGGRSHDRFRARGGAHYRRPRWVGPVRVRPRALGADLRMDAAKAAGDDVKAQVEARFWTGPYIVTEINSEELVMEPNEDYWGGPPPPRRGHRPVHPRCPGTSPRGPGGEADLALYPEAATAGHSRAASTPRSSPPSSSPTPRYECR